MTDAAKTKNSAPFTGSIKRVRDDWVDYNGHFNMAYYSVLFDQTCDEAFETVGLGPDYLAQSQHSYFTLQAQVSYLRELHAGDEVRVTLHLLDFDEKRVHYVQEMFHAKEGWLSATMEALAMHVSMAEKRATAFPADIYEKIAALHKAHAGLPVPAQVGQTIGIRRKS